MTEVDDTKKFYDDALVYWTGIDASVNGMLGGFAQISSTDISGSSKFLRQYIKDPNGTGDARALDCGAGIGRITKRLLLPLFQSVDMLEFNRKFLDEAPKYIGEILWPRVTHRFCTPMQEFTPEIGAYNVIWIQWVLGHLTEEDFISFFGRCRRALAPNGVIFVKENVCFEEEPIFDTDDSSFTRSLAIFLRLFDSSGLSLLDKQKQSGFPKAIYDVWLFALR